MAVSPDLLQHGKAAMGRAVGLVLLLGTLSCIGAETLLILKDDFESYTSNEALSSFWTGGTAQLETSPPGGGQAASHNGGDPNKHSGFTIGPDAQHQVVLSADFYDFATNVSKRVTVALRRTTEGSFEMGLQGNSVYVARAQGTFAGKTNWVGLKAGQPAVPGWHRFRAVFSLTNVVVTLDLQADGSTDGTAEIPFIAPPGEFTQIRFGGLLGRPSRGGPVLVDNIRLEVVSLQPAQQPILPAQPVTGSPAAPPPQSSNYPAIAWWILAALTIIIALLAGLLFMIRNSWPVRSRSRPMPRQSAALLEGPADGEGWPATGGNAVSAVRPGQTAAEKIGPELTDFAKQALVQGLYTQRNALLETQRKAQQALAELEQRLRELQLPMPERIRAYEDRIAELEKELETRGAEMRELTHATLLLVRQKLEQEREKDDPRF